MADTPIARALISVFDKTGLVPFAKFLADHDVELLSTGGTARALTEAGMAVKEVSDHTGFPEMMGGRVKTLHPLIHGGVLARRDDTDHCASMEQHGIAAIDMVVSNLYPFEETLRRGADFADCIENIDIGGPALIRSAAKNHDFVTIVTDPSDYEAVMSEMSKSDGATGDALRRQLAATAFGRTAAYDALIAGWLEETAGHGFPQHFTIAGSLRQRLRYGENPHQEAAFYAGGDDRPGVATARQLQGKELSYNNLNDTDAAFALVAEFERPAVAIIKHANPCGVAEADTLRAAYENALACDPVSAFGGVIAINRLLDRATAEAIAELFAEVVIAPDAEDDAIAALEGKKNMRLLISGAVPVPSAAALNVRSLAGGFLVQGGDSMFVREADLKVVTTRAPSKAELKDLLFACRVAKHAKSNAIVYARGSRTVGVGAGQMSRVDAARIAAWKAAEHLGAAGSVVASDAFFPFADGLHVAIEAGVTAAIQPGGSLRDDEIIAAANEADVAMVFTGLRHFRH
jgi:phosphoribosylaminoimidazolecarboxamide formyltransferase/IMP cyclohydrolase